ncbi:MAG: GNAT family N-acetyltransferase [Defluviitaleaceae bacterium]|nr:GNAT family N-acetyltransferase [Defluviitaleaceae bacterium]
MVTLKEVFGVNEKSLIANTVLRALPDWFAIELSIVGYVRDVADLTFIAAYDEETAIGFVAIKKHNPYTAEVYVMGVLHEYHRHGVGKMLIHSCEDYCSRNNMKFLSVKTLSERVVNEFYEKTRKFYLSMGFLPLEVFDTLWGENNPCLLMVKVLYSKNLVNH